VQFEKHGVNQNSANINVQREDVWSQQLKPQSEYFCYIFCLKVMPWVAVVLTGHADTVMDASDHDDVTTYVCCAFEDSPTELRVIFCCF
jgi:hypothetical protein